MLVQPHLPTQRRLLYKPERSRGYKINSHSEAQNKMISSLHCICCKRNV